MAQALIFPKLGQTMEEGAIVKWLKKEGDVVAKGDILFEIETDKANLEVESFFDGTLLKIYVEEGITVPVNTIVGYLGEVGEAIPDLPPAPVAPPAPTPAATPSAAVTAPVTPAPTSAPPAQAPRAPLSAPPAAVPAAPQKLKISPRARVLARESCIDPADIRGSGPQGRIVTKDVEAWLAAHDYAQLLITPAAKQLARREALNILKLRGSGERGRILLSDVEKALATRPVPLSRMRQVIARRLTESKQTIPHFYVSAQVDLTALQQLRTALKDAGHAYSINDFILMAVALSLTEFPVVNSSTDGHSITWHGAVDLGMAVSVDNGLVVPVIRNADTLSLRELAAQARELAQRARAGNLLPDEMSGSSFSVSNMGMLQVDQFNAIINPGEAGILAIASAKQSPVVRDGKIAIALMMTMTLSVDHRIVDGAVAATFINAIREKLENMALWQTLAT